MNRCHRVFAVFLLTLTLALPVAARPAPIQTWDTLFAALWARLGPVLGVSEKSRAGADPNGATPPSRKSRSSADPDGGTTTATPPAGEGSSTTQDDGDSRSSADPNG